MGLYEDIRAAGWFFRNARSFDTEKLHASAVAVVSAAVGLYLLGERRDVIRAAVSSATGFYRAVGPAFRRLI